MADQEPLPVGTESHDAPLANEAANLRIVFLEVAQEKMPLLLALLPASAKVVGVTPIAERSSDLRISLLCDGWPHPSNCATLVVADSGFTRISCLAPLY